MAEFLDEKRREIDERLSELKPLVDEHQRLQAAADALDGLSPAADTASRRRGPREAAADKAAPRRRRAAKGKARGRPKGTGTRSKQALELVRANPGITIPEVADKLGIKQNYLYRVLPGLAEDGLVEKDGRGWRAKHSA